MRVAARIVLEVLRYVTPLRHIWHNYLEGDCEQVLVIDMPSRRMPLSTSMHDLGEQVFASGLSPNRQQGPEGGGGWGGGQAQAAIIAAAGRSHAKFVARLTRRARAHIALRRSSARRMRSLPLARSEQV